MAIQEVLERQYPGRRAQLKRDILSAALACFNDKGLEPTTIEDIRVRCDTSVGNIYHHFGNKDGLIAALYFCALDDQARQRTDYVKGTASAEARVAALVHAYLDWVTAEPELARFQFQARSAVAQGPNAAELADRNRQRNRQVREWLADPEQLGQLASVPMELLPSLIIGQAESYCRAWLSGRVQSPPDRFSEPLARAAWASIAACR
ncbi:TetR family transcriptional regulator [Fluviicoccus keumensis]|uniref:TetR family transcriptional regulator n=1 Tax=Fluviicoccus keumensis TaxID=1435465 RepID=A0A4V2G3X6_9GAMM|nr:TetR/AcrR family transcriptional regulator [Fluviicoccus keumensis]RZU38716.1 TetR family transcriptional regulator [Fluviicoccus keumensis]